MYANRPDGFLAFVYAPPLAVLMAPLSVLPVEVTLVLMFIGQLAGFRYIAGSWLTAGLLAWLPLIYRELITGNVNFVMAAVMLASVRGLRGSGYLVALFSFAKGSPAATLILGRWREALIAGSLLILMTLPWLNLWPEWVTMLLTTHRNGTIPLLPRIPVAIALLALRSPSSVLAGAALLTPAFYVPNSYVLLLPLISLYSDRAKFPQVGIAQRWRSSR